MEPEEGLPIAPADNVEAVHRRLTEVGIVFPPENGGGVGVCVGTGVAKPAIATSSKPVLRKKCRREATTLRAEETPLSPTRHPSRFALM